MKDNSRKNTYEIIDHTKTQHEETRLQGHHNHLASAKKQDAIKETLDGFRDDMTVLLAHSALALSSQKGPRPNTVEYDEDVSSRASLLSTHPDSKENERALEGKVRRLELELRNRDERICALTGPARNPPESAKRKRDTAIRKKTAEIKYYETRARAQDKRTKAEGKL